MTKLETTEHQLDWVEQNPLLVTPIKRRYMRGGIDLAQTHDDPVLAGKTTAFVIGYNKVKFNVSN